jgi:hypothetical protein
VAIGLLALLWRGRGPAAQSNPGAVSRADPAARAREDEVRALVQQYGLRLQDYDRRRLELAARRPHARRERARPASGARVRAALQGLHRAR